MARGRKTPPAKLRAAARAATETGSIAEASRRTGVPTSTIRHALTAAELAEARLAHARNVAAGIREGATALAYANAKVAGMLAHEALEPRDLAALANATARVSDSMLAVAKRDDERRQAALSRRKTRTEIALNEARAAGTLPPERHDVTTIDVTDPDAVRRRLADVAARALARADAAGAGGGAGVPGGAGEPAAAGDGEPPGVHRDGDA